MIFDIANGVIAGLIASSILAALAFIVRNLSKNTEPHSKQGMSRSQTPNVPYRDIFDDRSPRESNLHLLRLLLTLFLIVLCIPITFGLVYAYRQIYFIYHPTCFLSAVFVGILALLAFIVVLLEPSLIGASEITILDIILGIVYGAVLIPYTIFAIALMLVIFGSPIILAYVLDAVGAKGAIDDLLRDIYTLLQNFHESLKKN